MKNIHVLPIAKPSRLIKNINGQLKLTIQTLPKDAEIGCYPQNIYITSTEEIKEGDWFYDLDTKYVKIKQSWENSHLNFKGKKIILTTDQDLIKDGVQAIDDEFLGWFVKNPSCEYVEVSEDYFKPSNMVYGHDTEPYKIIIPKEEPKLSNICIKCGVDLYALEGKFVCLKHPKECKGIYLSKETLLIHAAEQKQHLIDMMRNDEELGLYEEPEQTDEKGQPLTYWGGLTESKQETLEEFIEKEGYPEGVTQEIWEQGVREGAKWQQEQDNIANEILEYILLNDDGVGIALGYNSREMIENYFKRINYEK